MAEAMPSEMTLEQALDLACEVLTTAKGDAEEFAAVLGVADDASAAATANADARDSWREAKQFERALDWLLELLQQKGCERFDPACDGTLTGLCTIIIRG